MFPKTEKHCCVFKDYSVTFVLISTVSKFSGFFYCKIDGLANQLVRKRCQDLSLA